MIKIDGSTRVMKTNPTERPAFETLIITTSTRISTTTIISMTENVTAINENTTMPLTTSTTLYRINDSPCRNGGLYVYETKRCICKENISGEFCEEGTKLAYYGLNGFF